MTVVDVVWWASFIAVVVFILFAVVRFFYFPYKTHEGQEQRVKDLTDELNTRAGIRSLCEKLAAFNREGIEIQRKCTPTRFSGKDIKDWLNRVEAYLRTLDSIHLDDWLDENGMSRLEEKEQRGSNREERNLYQTFIFRLTQSQRMRSKWADSLGQRGLVSHETNPTIA